MGAPIDLASVLWPDADQGRQPQGATAISQANALSPKTGLWIPDRDIVSQAGVTYGSTGADPSLIIGPSGRALYTNGKWVQSDLPANAFTALTWVALIKPDAAPSAADFNSFFQTGQTTFNWDHAAAGYQGAFSLNDGGTYPTCKFTSGFTAGAEVLIGGTYDGTTLKVFRNGGLENSQAAGNSLTGVTLNPLQFLGGNGGTAPWAGSCSYFYWDTTRALTDGQMSTLMRDKSSIWQVVAPAPLATYAKPAAGGGTTISATPGAYTWAGITSAVPGQVNATVGSYSWTGITAGITQVIAMGTGAYAWSGTTATTSALINASAGAYAWSGVTATLSGGIAASPGSYTWSGTTSAIPGLVNATPAAWTWAGVLASIPAQINSTAGLYTWSGTTATMPGQITAIKAAYTWTGTTANLGGTLSKNGSYYLEIDEGLAVMVGFPMFPNWNTAGRPVSPRNYAYGFNSDSSKLEMWNGSAWVGTLLS